MKLRKLRSPFWSLFAAVLILALPLVGSAAPPRGGGAPHGGAPHAASAPHFSGGSRGGGFSGGSLRGGGAVAPAPRGGAAVRGPRGGAAVRAPGGQRAYRPSYPGGAYFPGGAYYGGPDYGGWGDYYGPDLGAAIAGIIAALAIGTVLAALPPGAEAQEFGGQTYYYDGTNYYQACYQGADLDYCVVPNPQ